MSGEGLRPSGGVRLSLTLDPFDGEAPAGGVFVYRGTILVGDRTTSVVARASAAEATVEIDAGELGADRAKVEKTVRALVRAATRAEIEGGAPPPRRITRWREI